MLDHLRIAIPVFSTYVNSLNNNHKFVVDLLDVGLPCATRHVSRGLNGELITGDLFHPYESLGTDYSDMAFKFYTHTQNILPHVELKASPLKLLQGHNVFGFDDIDLAATEMLGMFMETYPELCGYLDFDKADVLHLDTTFFSRLPHQNMVQPVLDYLANISSGHRKARQVKYQNYITWGSDNSRRLRPKAYGKFEELKGQLAKEQKKSEKGCTRAKRLVIAMHDVLQFSNAVIRFEARVCKQHMVDNDIPTNLWKLIEHQHANPNLLTDLWHVVFDPIFDAMKGNQMNYADDDAIQDLLNDKLKTVTAKGNISYTRAKNAMRFYKLLRLDGFTKVKASYSN